MDELALDAKTENLDKVMAFVDGYLEEKGCPVKVQRQIDVAVEELFVNIASYAYNPKVGKVTIRLEEHRNPHAVSITFTDSGVPYNPLARKDPDVTLSAEERPIGGLGIYMVKKCMDGIRYDYKNGQNILKIKKEIWKMIRKG